MKQTSDHIRPFFWLPSDMREDMKGPRVEEIVNQCWVNLAKKKNGGYEPVPLARGWHRDQVTNKPVFSSGRDVKILCVGPIKVPFGHQLYKEGHDTYVLRYPDHSFIQFAKIQNEGVKTLTLPDRIMADLVRKGVMHVLEWDTDEGRRAYEESLEPETREQKEYREDRIQTRGAPIKQVVPYT